MFLQGNVWLHILTVTDVFIGDCLITYTNSNWCFIGDCLITYTNSNWYFDMELFGYIY